MFHWIRNTCKNKDFMFSILYYATAFFILFYQRILKLKKLNIAFCQNFTPERSIKYIYKNTIFITTFGLKERWPAKHKLQAWILSNLSSDFLYWIFCVKILLFVWKPRPVRRCKVKSMVLVHMEGSMFCSRGVTLTVGLNAKSASSSWK